MGPLKGRSTANPDDVVNFYDDPPDNRRPRVAVEMSCEEYAYDGSVIMTAAVEDMRSTFEIPMRIMRGARDIHNFTRAQADRIAAQYTQDVARRIHEITMRTLASNERVIERDMAWHANYAIWNHGLDVARGWIDRLEKPEKAEEIKCLSPYPKLIEEGPLKAELMHDTMRLWEESENMRHCIYKSYTKMIQAGAYMAYHITGEKTKSGYTVGFKASGGKWIFDQVEGKARSKPQEELKPFIVNMLHQINACGRPKADKNTLSSYIWQCTA